MANLNYYVSYYLPSGKRIRKKIGPSKRVAEKVMAKIKVNIVEGRYLDIKKQEKIQFKDFCNTFYRLHSKPNKKSFRSDYYTLNTLKSFFGRKYLYEITQKDVEEFKAKRREEVSPASVNRELALLKVMYTKAIQWNKIELNPSKNVTFYRENNTRLKYLEKEEISKLIDACSEKLRPIVILALHTGMRRGEILNLKWHDIDFGRGIIYLLDTKNSTAREVFMNDLVIKTLIAVPKHSNSPYLFCNKHGRPYHDIRKSYFTALKKSGILNFRFHDLRHVFASQLAMAGVDLNTIRELLGHKDIRMTLRYAHLRPEHKKRAVDILCKQIVTGQSLEESADFSEEKPVLQHIEN